MRQLAWLNAVPEKAKQSRGARADADGVPFDMPEASALHMIDYFAEVGPLMYGGMSAAPLPDTEIAAWQSNTGVDLSNWEARTLRSMSKAYLLEMQAAKDPARRPPFGQLLRNPNVDAQLDVFLD